MLYCYKLNPDNDLYIDFVHLFKKVLRLLEAKIKPINLVWTDNKAIKWKIWLINVRKKLKLVLLPITLSFYLNSFFNY